MSRYRVRGFQTKDAPVCVALLSSNTPTFFTKDELAEFASWLSARTSPYFVVHDSHENRIVGCGGYSLGPDLGSAGLTWGMVARDVHRRGIGTLLLEARLRRLTEAGVSEVLLDTSQHSRGFYGRHGFEVVTIQADGYRPGLDRWNMRRSLGVSRDALT